MAHKKLKAKILNQIFPTPARIDMGQNTLEQVAYLVVDEESSLQGVSHETNFQISDHGLIH
jgi:hypothetical protein